MKIPPIARLLLFGSTAGGFVLTAFTLLVEPPPVWVSVLALVGYISFVVGGVIFSRFSMFADVITLGPRDGSGVALTFDDGPDPESTPLVLDLLDEHQAKATFFVIGHKAEAHPELLREISDRGHSIGVHSYAHEWFYSFRSPAYIRADLERALAAIQKAVGYRPSLFRAPIGHISPSMASVVRELDLHAIGWSARGVDGLSSAKPEQVAQKIIHKLKDGCIVLLHDAAEKGGYIPASVEALPAIFAEVARLQLSYVRVDRWLSPDEDCEPA